MFSEAYHEEASCLTYVLHITYWTGYLIYPAFFVFALGLSRLSCLEFSNSIVDRVCNFYVGVLEYFGDGSCFFTCMSELCPSCFVRNFLRLYCWGTVLRDLVVIAAVYQDLLYCVVLILQVLVGRSSFCCRDSELQTSYVPLDGRNQPRL